MRNGSFLQRAIFRSERDHNVSISKRRLLSNSQQCIKMRWFFVHFFSCSFACLPFVIRTIKTTFTTSHFSFVFRLNQISFRSSNEAENRHKKETNNPCKKKRQKHKKQKKNSNRPKNARIFFLYDFIQIVVKVLLDWLTPIYWNIASNFIAIHSVCFVFALLLGFFCSLSVCRSSCCYRCRHRFISSLSPIFFVFIFSKFFFRSFPFSLLFSPFFFDCCLHSIHFPSVDGPKATTFG